MVGWSRNSESMFHAKKFDKIILRKSFEKFVLDKNLVKSLYDQSLVLPLLHISEFATTEFCPVSIYLICNFNDDFANHFPTRIEIIQNLYCQAFSIQNRNLFIEWKWPIFQKPSLINKIVTHQTNVAMVCCCVSFYFDFCFQVYRVNRIICWMSNQIPISIWII